MKVLALDPATQCGWAISNDIYGTWDLRIKRDESAGMKLIRLRSKLKEICESEEIELIVFETPASRFKAPIMSHASLNAIISQVSVSISINTLHFGHNIITFASGIKLSPLNRIDMLLQESKLH